MCVMGFDFTTSDVSLLCLRFPFLRGQCLVEPNLSHCQLSSCVTGAPRGVIKTRASLRGGALAGSLPLRAFNARTDSAWAQATLSDKVTRATGGQHVMGSVSSSWQRVLQGAYRGSRPRFQLGARAESVGSALNTCCPFIYRECCRKTQPRSGWIGTSTV